MPKNNKTIAVLNILCIALLFIIVPALIVIGFKYKSYINYYAVATMIVILSIIPFFIKFEKKHPTTRDIVIIAVMCAIAVTSRIAFFFIPQFKPIIAVIIITGISFGKETGFLTGCLSMFVSNIFFGQGPWTPWQMFGAAVTGYLAGMIFYRRYNIQKTMYICVFGGIATLLVYGGVVNFSTYLLAAGKHNFKSLLAVYISGFLFDLIHAVSTVVFLFVGSKAILKKLNRIKIKYNLV